MTSAAFFPGFFLSLGLFPLKTVSLPYRVGWSFFLSIACVPLTLYVLNRVFGMPIHFYSVVGVMGVISMAGILLFVARGRAQKKGLQ